MKRSSKTTPRLDECLMWRALGLARRGLGLTGLNPLVGALVVRDGRIVGRGFHGQSGVDHAEVIALREAGKLAEGATLYVSLEPCNHQGRTPPCTGAVLASGVRRVVIASRDSNPAYLGGGADKLAAAGLELEPAVLREQADRLNAGWFKWVQTKLPRLTLKLALSQDLKIARADGDSKWISGPISRAHVHRLRAQKQAILIGTETARIDDPELTNRSGHGPQPLRVVLDRQLELSDQLQLFSARSKSGLTAAGTLRVCGLRADLKRRAACESEQVSVMALEEVDGRLDLAELLLRLGQRGVQNVLCEGGAVLGHELLERGLVDELLIYRAPLELGAGGREFKLPNWPRVEVRRMGLDQFERYLPLVKG